MKLGKPLIEVLCGNGMNKILKSGDLALDSKLGIGLVMRHDEEHGLLMAFPGMDRLISARAQELEWQASLSERTDLFTLSELRLICAAFRSTDLKALLAEFEAALDARIKERLK